MGMRKGTAKGVVAVVSGAVAQLSGRVPEILLSGQFAEFGQYLGFVVGASAALLVSDVLTGDVTPGRPLLGAAKGLSAGLGAAFPLLFLADVGALVWLCGTVVGGLIEGVVGVGGCYPYLVMVLGTFAGVVIGDVVLAPFSGR